MDSPQPFSSGSNRGRTPPPHSPMPGCPLPFPIRLTSDNPGGNVPPGSVPFFEGMKTGSTTRVMVGFIQWLLMRIPFGYGIPNTDGYGLPGRSTRTFIVTRTELGSISWQHRIPRRITTTSRQKLSSQSTPCAKRAPPCPLGNFKTLLPIRP